MAMGTLRSRGSRGYSLLPVAVLALAAPQALGADAAGRAGSALQAPTSDFEPLPDGDPVSIGLMEYASRAVFEQGRSMQGRTVRLVGFVLVGDDGPPYLARLIVSCCAADARPIKIGMTGNLPKGLTADTWLSVIGSYSSQTVQDPVNGATIPYVNVSEAQQVERPTTRSRSNRASPIDLDDAVGFVVGRVQRRSRAVDAQPDRPHTASAAAM